MVIDRLVESAGEVAIMVLAVPAGLTAESRCYAEHRRQLFHSLGAERPRHLPGRPLRERGAGAARWSDAN